MIDKSDYLLSIIIPVYNCADFIVSTLSSLHTGITKEVEIIIINDGSTDQTDKQILYFYKIPPCYNLKVINQRNQGVAIARNTGLKEATGKYIAFVDGDDIVSSNYFDVLLPLIREEKYDIIEFMLTRDMEELYTFEKKSDIQNNKKEILLSDDNYTALIPTFKAAQWHLATKVFRRNIIGEDRFESHRRYEDIIFCPFQYFKCKLILKLNIKLYYYRFNSSSITENLDEHDADHIFFAMRKMCNYIKNNQQTKSVASLMIENCFLEGRKIIRKTKGYYAYNEKMLNDIETALTSCDYKIVNKKNIYKMKFKKIDSLISLGRFQLLKILKK